MNLVQFIAFTSFIGLYAVLILVYIIIEYQDKQNRGPWMFRVDYSVILHDLVSGESMRSSAHQKIEAVSEADAISKVKEILAIQTERESKDLGVCPREYSEFQATKI